MLLLSILLSLAPPSGTAAVRLDETVSGRDVVMVVPDRQSGSIPLIIALHGCDQTAVEFLEASRLEALVDAEGVALALPRARGGGDNPLGCWQWWDAGNQRRDGSDPALMIRIIASMEVRIDPRRIYAVGLSSGGAMAAILGAVYPDVFAAVGIHSGVGFAAAANTACALKILDDVPGDAEERGRLAYLHQSARRIVPTMVVHGVDDDVVDPDHAGALVREIAQRNDFIDDDRDNDSFDADPDMEREVTGPCPSADGDCYSYTLMRFEDRDGGVALERVSVAELGHAWSGGSGDHAYADPRGPDAGALFWTFFRRHALDPDVLTAAPPPLCVDWWAPPWWHYWWAGTMSFSEYTCDMNPWSMVWRHRIDGVSGPGRCP